MPLSGSASQTNPEQLQQQAVMLCEAYLAANGLTDVWIDARRYEPIEQWQRLKSNDRIAPVWKFTAGVLDVVGYTLFPKRAFHADAYSPYTNTLSINSTQPASALYQAALAKEYNKQRWIGSYAMLQRAPIAGLFHRVGAASDVLTYALVNDNAELISELYSHTYSELGSATIGDALVFSPLPSDSPSLVAPLVRVAGSATGGMVGRVVAKQHQEDAEFDDCDLSLEIPTHEREWLEK